MPARILVVEDNPANLELMTYLLAAFGHTPLTACDGHEGLGVARREAPDLILCDVQLPRMDGYEVAKRLKSDPALRKVPLVAVTAYAMVGDRDKILTAGFDGYMAKPIVPETFVAQVETFLNADDRSAEQTQQIVAAPTTEAPAVLPERGVILILDDSPSNLSVLRSILEPFGYRVIAADGVEQALALARHHAPDLIVSDVHVRKESGYDFIRAVKADPQLRPIPFMFLSSTLWGQKDRRIGLDLGADSFILRPIEPQALLAEIESCLQKQVEV
jgi:two-component system cell cycle response regulator